MLIYRKNITLLLVCFLYPFAILAQFNNNSNELESYFSYDRIETFPGKSVFNIITIINKSSYQKNYVLSFNLPDEWNLMCDNNIAFEIEPQDTLLYPIRFSISKNVKGEIGYAVVGSIQDNKGNKLSTAYCFVNVPKVTNIQFNVKNRYEYFNERTNSANFTLNLKNNGNSNELIHLSATIPKNLIMPAADNHLFNQAISLPPGADTNVVYTVYKKDQFSDKSYQMDKININAQTTDTSFFRIVWFKETTDRYTNKISETNKALIIETDILNLFSNDKLVFNGRIFGNILFKNNRNINYYYYNNTGEFDSESLKSGRYYVGYKSPDIQLRAGHVNDDYEYSIFGNGLHSNIKLSDKIRSSFIFAKNRNLPIKDYGGSFGFELSKNIAIEPGFVFSEDDYYNRHSNIYFLGLKTTIFKNHSLSIRNSYSTSNYTKDTNFVSNGYRNHTSYHGKIGKLRINFQSDYTSPNHAGSTNRGLRINSGLIFPFSDMTTLNIDYNKISFYNPKQDYIFNENLQSYFSDRINIHFNRRLKSGISVFGGTSFENYFSNSYSRERDDYFGFEKYQLQTGLRYPFGDTYGIIITSMKAGFSKIAKKFDYYQIETQNQKDLTPAFLFSLNIKRKNWGVISNYYYGPYNIGHFFSHVYFGIENKSFRVMPFYQRYIYKKILKYEVRVNLFNNLETNSTRIFLTNKIIGYFNHGISFFLVNNLNYTSTIDKTTGSNYQYHNSYFHLRIRKEFGFNQPRVKFNDFTIVLYKDINGNRQKDPNEPGLQDVLTKIERNYSKNAISNFEGNDGSFSSIELMSSPEGIVSVENIPHGWYTVTLKALGDYIGNFTSRQSRFDVLINKDKTIYIPFLEINKIFGRIVLNRAKISQLGDISLENIKITAYDSEGGVTSTLTDRDGKFILYVPNVDKYRVHINNVFKEHFDLEQNDFLVQLNGYKQFELTFIFNEREREIKFSDDVLKDVLQNGDDEFGIDMPDMSVIKRTTLEGFVKHSNTLEPLRAMVKIVDAETDGIIAQTSTDVSGKYSLTFMSGDNYKVVVVSEGYWLHQEKLEIDQVTTFQNIKKDFLLKEIKAGDKISVDYLHFAEGESDLYPGAEESLDALLQMLEDNPRVKIEIRGYRDLLESRRYPNISEDRARIVKNYLVQHGLNPDRVVVKDFKDTHAVRINDEKGRRMNRRVQIHVLSY